MTYPNPPTDPDLRLILDAYYNAPCPRCGRTKPCRCLREGEDRYFRFRAILDGLAAAGRLTDGTDLQPVALHTGERLHVHDSGRTQWDVGGVRPDGSGWRPAYWPAPTPPPTTGQPASPWAEPGDPCADCKCPKDWHRNGVGPCTGDFMHCPCRAYQPPTRPQED